MQLHHDFNRRFPGIKCGSNLEQLSIPMQAKTFGIFMGYNQHKPGLSDAQFGRFTLCVPSPGSGPKLHVMASIKPFPALCPNPELAALICELPYDVMSSAEARDMAAGNPLSFLHVSKPEIDLPPATDPYEANVYAKAKENFSLLIADGALRQ